MFAAQLSWAINVVPLCRSTTFRAAGSIDRQIDLSPYILDETYTEELSDLYYLSIKSSGQVLFSGWLNVFLLSVLTFHSQNDFYF